MDRVIEPLPVAPSKVFGPDTANEEICPIAFVWSAVSELAFLLIRPAAAAIALLAVSWSAAESFAP